MKQYKYFYAKKRFIPPEAFSNEAMALVYERHVSEGVRGFTDFILP
jgi:hypothetical protein